MSDEYAILIYNYDNFKNIIKQTNKEDLFKIKFYYNKIFIIKNALKNNSYNDLDMDDLFCCVFDFKLNYIVDKLK